ncbi:MAG: thiS [Flavipsychrobacter sp.]|nr:thiS [Flavipsychrobacter sp.]
MNIYVNNKQQELPTQANVQDAIDVLNMPSVKGIAIAVNNAVVPKADWETYVLSENDKITLIKATQGG